MPINYKVIIEHDYYGASTGYYIKKGYIRDCDIFMYGSGITFQTFNNCKPYQSIQQYVIVNTRMSAW